MSEKLKAKVISCFHCGEICYDESITNKEKVFCCEGCKMVFGILNENGLCDYYELNRNPGINQRIKIRKGKFDFLADKKIQSRLLSFQDEKQAHVSFFLPQVHCSSCLYLLENLHKIESGIISGKVNFTRKEVTVVYSVQKISLQEVVGTLASIGYEPYISLNDLDEKRPAINKGMVYRLGVAGFCFGNIMLLSFPEYLGIDASEEGLRGVFRWVSFFLSLPVLLYSAQPFYTSSWNSLKHKFLNIDAPIALAIIITFIRSAWEVITGSGGGYFDSMTGIIFFMLAGRMLQDKTYRQLSFERDYTSYFPVAVSVLDAEKEVPTTLPDLKPGNTMLIHNEELIPADGILTRGKALIDYSFVTGESVPVFKEVGELVYAGGKQTGGNIEILVVKEVAQSYLTQLWNKEEFGKQEDAPRSFVHLISRYFTYIVFTIAIVTAVYWGMMDTDRIWPAITAIFIIACPCALLLSSTFTNGNILRILSRNGLYLRNAQTIEDIAGASHFVFDKTGTLTTSYSQDLSYEGTTLTAYQLRQVASLAACSFHPLSKAISRHLGQRKNLPVSGFRETAGQGIEGFVENDLVKIGSYHFVTGKEQRPAGTAIFISFEDKLKGYFLFKNNYRDDIAPVISSLGKNYHLSVLSGDNEAEKENIRQLMGKGADLRFNQSPGEKLNYVRELQQKGEKVIMIGDGLNDAGALKQSDVGIAVAEQTNNFTPASDAIIEAKQLGRLTHFIRLCKANRDIITASFVLSIVYNIIGLFFAVQGTLSPLVAAILMPSSSLSILLLTFGSSNLLARHLRL